MEITSRKLHPTDGRRRNEERMFQLLFLLSFPIFLAMALGTRALPGTKSGADAGLQRGSLLSDAASAARSTIAIALAD